MRKEMGEMVPEETPKSGLKHRLPTAKQAAGIALVLLMGMLILASGPVQAVLVDISTSVVDINGNGIPGQGDNMTVTANVTIENGELIPIINITLNMTKGNIGVLNCQLPLMNYTITNYPVVCRDYWGNNITLYVTLSLPGNMGYGVGYAYSNEAGSFAASGTYSINQTGFGWGYGGYNWNTTLGDYQYGFGTSYFTYAITFTVPGTWAAGTYTSAVDITTPPRYGTSTDYVIHTSDPDDMALPDLPSNPSAGGGGLTPTTVGTQPLAAATAGGAGSDTMNMALAMGAILGGAWLFFSMGKK